MAQDRKRKLPRSVRAHRGKYRAVFEVDGQRLRSPTFDTPAEAAEWMRSFKAKPVIPAQRKTLRDLYEALLEELKEQGASEQTKVYYRNHWRIVSSENGWDPELPIYRFTVDQARRYIEKRRQDGLSDATIFGKEIQVLDRLLNLAAREQWIPANPLKQLRRPKLRQRRFDFMPMDHIGRLADTIENWGGQVRTPQRDADWIRVFALLGIRRQEMVRLSPDDIDWQGDRVFVRGKNDDRYLPLTELVRAPLSRLVAATPPGETIGLTEGTIERAIDRWQKRLEEPRLYCHALRHSYGTAMARNGCDPFVLRDLMGHSDLKQTLRYYHTQADRNREAAESLSFHGVRQTDPEGRRGGTA